MYLGILVKNEECKISQYADDSALILDGNILSFEHALKLLDEFTYISGLKVNYDKSEALWIGSQRDNTNIYFPERKIQWSRDKVNALGVWFSATNQDIVYLNYAERLNVRNNWHLRRQTCWVKLLLLNL